MTNVSWFLLVAFILLAGTIIVRMFPKGKKNLNILYIEALEQLIKGNTENALRLLHQFVKVETGKINAYLILGNILRETGSSEKATAIHQSITTRSKLTHEQKIDVYMSLAKDYQKLKKYKKAKEYVNLVLKLDKKNLWALSFLVEVAELQMDWEKAIDYRKRYERILGKQEPARFASYYTKMGLVEEKKRDFTKAKDRYLKALKIDPTFTNAHLYLANLFEKEGLLDKAIEYWMSYEGLSPKGDHVFNKIEKSLYELGKFGEIESFYSRIISENEGNISAISGYVNVLSAKGELSKAHSIVEKLLEKNKQSIRGRLARLKLSLREHHQDQLLQDIDEIVELLHSDNDNQSVSE